LRSHSKASSDLFLRLRFSSSSSPCSLHLGLIAGNDAAGRLAAFDARREQFWIDSEKRAQLKRKQQHPLPHRRFGNE
jgi:hypothetical protein